MGRLRLCSVAALMVSLAGCGRSPLGLEDGGTDLRPPDLGPPPEGVKPCAPTCTEICKLRQNCALLPAGGFDLCVAACELAPSLPTNLCLGQVVCRGGTGSCKEVQGCVTSPTLPDLSVASFGTTAGSGQIAFKLEVCNHGSATAPSSTLHLYLNRLVAPASGEAGDRILKLEALAPGACLERSSVETVAGGTYSSWVQVDAENAILELDEKNNVAGPSISEVSGVPLPDLTVTSLSAAASGGSATYVARVCNIGSVASGATKLDVYVNLASPPTVGQVGNASAELAALAAGSCRQLTLSAVPIGSGPQSSWAMVDRPNLVAEHSEKNNVFGPVLVQPSALSDLLIASVEVLDGGGVTASFSATVCNQGTATSGPVDLSFYPHRTSAPDASALPTLSKTVAPLPPGECTTLSWYYGYPSSGSYTAWLWVDRLGVEAEADEKNNTFGPVKVVVGGGLPDLTVSLAAVTGSSGTVTYTATVCNKGIGPSAPASLDLYYHSPSPPPPVQVGDQSSSVPAILPGECAAVKLVASLATGTYLSLAWIDRTNLVQETVEGNNLSSTITVSVNAGAGPDLVVSSLTTFVNANYVYYYLSVCNAGTGYSAVSTVELYYNRSTPPTVTSVGDQSKPVISLGVGGCTSFTFATTLPAGTYQAWAYIDRVDVAKESNETNNIKGPVVVYVSGGQGVDLVVSSMSYDPATGAYAVTVCNKGGGTSWSCTLDLYYNRPTAPKSSEAGNASLPVGSLTGGACTKLSHVAKLSGGTYTSWAYVDRQGQAPETDETNNLYGPLLFSIGTGTADLVLSSLYAQVTPSGQVSYSIGVCNKGTATSGSCFLSVYYDLPSAPTAANKADGSIFIGGIASGLCTSFVWLGTLAPGSHTSWAWVDSTEMVKEQNEQNNIGGPTKVVVGIADPCEQICDALVSPCGLLPQSQHASCVSSCKGRSQSKIDCALKALAQGKCLEIISCLFS